MHLPSNVLKICFLCQLLLKFTCEAKPPGCAGVVCPEPLVCSFPKSPIVLNNPAVCCPKTVCVCEGTQSRTSSDNNQDRQLASLSKRYTNCTLVDGNLELTHLTTSQIDFTKHIEQVTGYVLISRVYADYIDLSSLQLIRGIERYMESNIVSHCPTKPVARNETSNQYALYVEFCDDASTKPTSYLKELLLPNLTEISAGDVMFNKNSLCNMDKILWKREIFHDPKKQQFFDQDLHFRPCPTCTQCPRVKVNSTHTIPGPCWGGGSVDKCQIITKSNCTYCGHSSRCNRAGICCSELCAGGCMLAIDSTAEKYKTCHACRNMNNNGQCVQSCPDGTKMNPDSTEIQKEANTFQFARYCVTRCPENVPQTGRFCKRYCEQGTFDYGDNKCTPCKTKNCENICYGLGVDHGPLKNNKWIDASNIKHFNKNCTIIEGSLLFIKLTFKGDKYCKIDQLALGEVRERFQNVREITGYLSVEFWQYQDLCLFKNLQRIRGKELKEQRYALIVYTGSYNLHQLCLNSLTEIDNGVAHIFQNIRLCYANTIDWLPITNASDEYTIAQNQAPSTCSKCNDNCASGCWGPDSTQCQSCKLYEDYTTSEGKFTSKWIPDPKTKFNMPGYNQTNCVAECNFTKGVYATVDMKCYPCNSECAKTCNGPTAFNCTKCMNSILNGECVPHCPASSHYNDMNGTCVSCHSSCIDGGCQGSEAKYGNLGCTKCHESLDPETLIFTHHGVQCRICTNHPELGMCDQGCTSYNKTSNFKCYYPPGEDYTPYIVLACLVFLVIAVVALFIFVRHRTTIKRMRKTIGKTMVGEQVLVENEKTPLTPSGASPNQAQLRIVKENELASGKLLGSGAFGEVHKAVWTPINIQGEKVKIAVAVKTLKTPEDMTATANNEIMDEAYMMASVDCIYLVRLLGVRMTEQVSLITQLMPLGSLLEYVRDSRNHESIPAGKMLTWCTQIAKGMAYLQEKHLVHRDLAARNVLVKTPNHVKITDFGLAKMLSAKEDTYQAEGGKLPIKWLAIECITERTFSHLSDVWAFGVTVWELLTLGARPYDGIRAVEMLSLLERGERLPQPPSATIDIYMVLIKCWMVDRACRPDFHELVQEFTTMAKDPSRYVVLKSDPGSAAACITSPSPTDEMQFFRKLLEEEELGSDGELMAEEPDQYLLHDNLAHQHSHQLQGNQYTTMVSVNSAGRPLGPEYENQPAVSSGHRSQHPNVSSGSAETSFIEGPRGQRLFSRNTPSAVFQSSVSSSGTAHGMNRIPEGEEMSGGPPIHDQDDVFSDGGQAKRNAAGPSPVNRKDSEETQRYTEDPTNRRAQFRSQSSNLSQGQSSFRYDEEDYLLPSNNSQMPAYLDLEGPSHAPPPRRHAHQRAPISNGGAPTQALMANEAYVEGNSLAPSKDDRSGYEELSACGKSPVIPRGAGEVDYVNMTEGESLTPTWFENAEYMATDSGIGEDTQSLLSRGNTGGRVNRKASTQSSFDENDEIAFRKSDARNRKKQQAGDKGARRTGNDPTWSGSSDDETGANSFRAAIENPEYMGLVQNRESTAKQELHTNI